MSRGTFIKFCKFLNLSEILSMISICTSLAENEIVVLRSAEMLTDGQTGGRADGRTNGRSTNSYENSSNEPFMHVS